MSSINLLTEYVNHWFSAGAGFLLGGGQQYLETFLAVLTEEGAVGIQWGRGLGSC